VDWFDFERGVAAKERAWCPAEGGTSDASRPERSFATLGQNERPREKQTKTHAII